MPFTRSPVHADRPADWYERPVGTHKSTDTPATAHIYEPICSFSFSSWQPVTVSISTASTELSMPFVFPSMSLRLLSHRTFKNLDADSFFILHHSKKDTSQPKTNTSTSLILCLFIVALVAVMLLLCFLLGVKKRRNREQQRKSKEKAESS